MINGIGSTGNGNGRVDLARSDAAQRGAAATAPDGLQPVTTPQKPSSSPAATLAALGAPIDADKIAAIRTAIANGQYPVNADAIAEKMISLDLPLKF